MGIYHQTIPAIGTANAIDQPQWAQSHVVDSSGVVFNDGSVQTIAAPTGVQQLLWYTLSWSPGTNANIALTKLPATIGGSWMFERVMFVSKNALLTGNAANFYLVVSTGANQTGTQFTINGFNNRQTDFHGGNYVTTAAWDMGLYLSHLISWISDASGGTNSTGGLGQPIIPAGQQIYAAVNGTGWDAAWLIDIYVFGTVLPVGP